MTKYFVEIKCKEYPEVLYYGYPYALRFFNDARISKCTWIYRQSTMKDFWEIECNEEDLSVLSLKFNIKPTSLIL